jgi:4-amino-4-deoxy-L-arabinose transferase-like glycosyltransferase
MSSRLWLLLIVAITIAVRLPTMFGVNRTGWDERAYVVFAKTVNDHGLTGIRKWMHDYPTDETLQRSPLLLRIGFLIPGIATCKLLGGFTVDNLAWLSFFCGVALVAVSVLFAQQLGGRKVAVVCAILLITSPLAAGLSRRAMQDSFASLLLVGCLYCFDLCWRRRGVIAAILLGLCLFIALLTRESALLLYPVMAIAAVYYFRAMKLRTSWWLLAPLFAAPLLYIVTEAIICGGISNFIETYRTYASLQQTLEYTVRYEKGPWFRYLVDLLAIAPVIFVGAIIGLSIPPADDASRHGRNLAVIYLVAGILLFAQLPIINVRLVLFVDMFLRLGAALAVLYIASQFGKNLTVWILPALIALFVLIDASQFYKIFVAGNTYSPTTFLLLRAEGFYDTPLTR